MFTAGVTGIYLKPYQDPALFKPDADIVGIFMVRTANEKPTET